MVFKNGHRDIGEHISFSLAKLLVKGHLWCYNSKTRQDGLERRRVTVYRDNFAHIKQCTQQAAALMRSLFFV